MAVPAALKKRAHEDLHSSISGEPTLSVSSAAEALGVHVQTVYRQLRTGKFPGRYVKIGSTWRISAVDVASLVAEVSA